MNDTRSYDQSSYCSYYITMWLFLILKSKRALIKLHDTIVGKQRIIGHKRQWLCSLCHKHDKISGGIRGTVEAHWTKVKVKGKGVCL